MTVEMRESPHRIRLERFRNFEEFDQHHQFVRLVDQFLLGLDQQWVTLHQPERTKSLRSHEHPAGVKIARHVVVERRQDDVLLAIDRAAGEHDGVLGMLEQMLGDRE